MDNYTILQTFENPRRGRQVLWSILKVIFKTNLSYLLTLVFVSLSLVFVHVLSSCFDLLFLLVLEFMPSSRIYLLPHQECYSLGIVRCQFFFTGGRVCGADLRYLGLISCGSAQASLFPYNSKPVAVLAIRNTIETLPVS